MRTSSHHSGTHPVCSITAFFETSSPANISVSLDQFPSERKRLSLWIQHPVPLSSSRCGCSPSVKHNTRRSSSTSHKRTLTFALNLSLPIPNSHRRSLRSVSLQIGLLQLRLSSVRSNASGQNKQIPTAKGICQLSTTSLRLSKPLR